jgi:hypothetical protein
VGYPPQAESVGRDYGRPIATMRAYLQAMTTEEPAYVRLLGANGPKMLALSGELTDGALPATGALLVRNPGFQADLRTVAPSPTGDRYTVQGGEDVDGYANNWSVVAYVICAPRPAGYEVNSQISPSNPTDPRKTIVGNCTPGKHLTGTGAATDPASPGGIGLENLFPQPNLTAAQALAEITQPPVVPWATMRTLTVCVS